MTAEQINLLNELAEVVIYDSDEYNYELISFDKVGDNIVVYGNEIDLSTIEDRAGWDVPIEGDTIKEVYEQVVIAVLLIVDNEDINPDVMEAIANDYCDNIHAEWRYTNGECDSEYSCNICPADYL